MKKTIYLTMMLAFVLIGCSAEQNTELEESIHSIVEDGNSEEININTLTTFEWEEAHLFHPYTPKEAMKERLGFNYRDKSNIQMRDDIFLLVFVKEDKVVQYAEINRPGVELSMEKDNYLTPSDDVISIDRY